MTQVPAARMNTGRTIPQLGFGVFQIPPRITAATVRSALEAGYRHVDTAAVYRNETEVGEAVRGSGVPREELFVTTKLANPEQGYDATMRAFDESLRKLGLEYLDLYLIHWPSPRRELYVETWRAFEKLLAGGRVRSIGVSNFKSGHLRRLMDETQTVPVLNQIALHPYFQQPELRAFHAEHGILTEAWAPLHQGGEVLGDPTVARIAEAHSRTPAQAVLRWHLQVGNVVIPRSKNPERIRENFDVFGFELSGEEMDAIAALDRGVRTGPDPDTWERP